jgi:hypothetical protein
MHDASHARKQLNVRVPVLVKEQLIRGAAFYDRSITNLIERVAAAFEARALQRLSEEDRRRYLARKIRPLRNKLGAQKPEAVAWAILSMQLTVKAKRELHRYANYMGISIATVLTLYAKNLERGILEKLTDEQRTTYLAGTLDPALFADELPQFFEEAVS